MRPDLLLALVALQSDLDPTLLQAIGWVESAHRPHVIVQNDGGSPSHGLTQIKLGTARMMNRHISSTELMNPWTNARTAAWYLKRQLARYGSIGCALVAYNRGSYKKCPEFDNYDRNSHPEYVRKIYRAMAEKPWLKRLKKVGKDAEPSSSYRNRAGQPRPNHRHH